MSQIKVTINGTERQSYIDAFSVRKNEVLSRGADSFTFNIKQYGEKQYLPALSDEIVVEMVGDTTERLFAGYIVDVDQSAEALTKIVKVTCKDYTHTLDKSLVSKTYENMTAQAVVQDLISTFATGFTTTNVGGADITVKKILFNYVTLSTALSKLCDTLGIFDWYVDYNKDINFFSIGERPAPFDIDDDGGKYVHQSLTVNRNNTQIRNKIIIRGGQVEGDTFTDKMSPDGIQRTIFVGYSISGLLVWQSSTTNTDGSYVALTIGNDGTSDENSFDCLYNPNNGLIRFRANNVPPANRYIKWSGKPIYPLITEKSDLVSQSLYGKFEHIIIDKTIKSKASASQRADAELAKYGKPQVTGSFRTIESGLRTGMYVRVNSPLHNVSDEYFKITQIRTSLRTNDPATLRHDVSMAYADEETLETILRGILERPADTLDYDSKNEVVDRLYSALETVAISDDNVVSKIHNPVTETITLSDNPSIKGLDFGTIFVTGEYLPDYTDPSDKKRPFLLDGSPLG